MLFSDDEIKLINNRKPCSGHINLDKDYTWKNVVHRLLNKNIKYQHFKDTNRWNFYINNDNIIPINKKIINTFNKNLKNVRKIEGQIFANKISSKVNKHIDFMHVFYILLKGKVLSSGKVLNPGDWEFYPIGTPHEFVHDSERISLSIAFYEKENNETIEK